MAPAGAPAWALTRGRVHPQSLSKHGEPGQRLLGWRTAGLTGWVARHAVRAPVTARSVTAVRAECRRGARPPPPRGQQSAVLPAGPWAQTGATPTPPSRGLGSWRAGRANRAS